MGSQLKIKVCGMKHNENVSDLIELQPNFIGFIFYPQSKRFVGENFDKTIVENIPQTVKKVGVFVNDEIENVSAKVLKYKLDFVQLHGNETSEYCEKLYRQNVNIIKAFSVNTTFDFDVLENYQNYVQFFLFDTPTLGFGGSGKKFDWEILEKYHLEKPFFLSGGIDVDDIQEIINMNHEKLFAIDINSRFETEPAKKDISKIKTFIEKLRQ